MLDCGAAKVPLAGPLGAGVGWKNPPLVYDRGKLRSLVREGLLSCDMKKAAADRLSASVVVKPIWGSLVNTLRGTVSSARATTAISGGGDHSPVQTTHILLFKVDGRQVKLSSASPAMISDNDIVLLAGSEKNGAFVAFAYRNETTGVIGDAGKLGPVIGVLVGLAGAAFSFSLFGSFSFGFFPKLIGLGFLAVATFSALRFLKVKSAADLLAATRA